MPFLRDWLIISVRNGRQISIDSVRCFTGIQELIADFFLFKECIIFLSSSGETSLNWNLLCILYSSLIFKTVK